MGGLFEEITKDTLELTINERIILFIRKFPHTNLHTIFLSTKFFRIEFLDVLQQFFRHFVQ